MKHGYWSRQEYDQAAGLGATDNCPCGSQLNWSVQLIFFFLQRNCLLIGNCQECSLQSGVVRKNRFKAGILGILTGLRTIFKCKFAKNVWLDSEANSLCETHGSQHAKCSCFAIYFSIGRVSAFSFYWRSILSPLL